jgi:hypothetical protein
VRSWLALRSRRCHDRLGDQRWSSGAKAASSARSSFVSFDPDKALSPADELLLDRVATLLLSVTDAKAQKARGQAIDTSRYLIESEALKQILRADRHRVNAQGIVSLEMRAGMAELLDVSLDVPVEDQTRQQLAEMYERIKVLQEENARLREQTAAVPAPQQTKQPEAPRPPNSVRILPAMRTNPGNEEFRKYVRPDGSISTPPHSGAGVSD